MLGVKPHKLGLREVGMQIHLVDKWHLTGGRFEPCEVLRKKVADSDLWIHREGLMGMLSDRCAPFTAHIRPAPAGVGAVQRDGKVRLLGVLLGWRCDRLSLAICRARRIAACARA